MNKVITDGLVLTPPAFAHGLDIWSRGDGTACSPTYDGFATAAYVPADQDFSGCLEILKTETTQHLRYMGETPLLPGCYLLITARVKAISGNLPTVQIAAYAGGAGGGAVGGVTTTGPATTLTSYGDVVEIKAIVGTGTRSGVDMAWGREALFGHFGIDITGANGGVIRVDDIQIEDITSAFLRTMMDWVDVRDFGAIGDGTTDNTDAFEAADAAAYAAGREVLVSEGVYHLADDMTFEARVRFQGTVSQPEDKKLTLRQNFDFPTYADAFGNEEEGFKRAFRTLITGTDHDTLDLAGRAISISAPIDMAAVAGITTSSVKRVIANGQIVPTSGSAWDATEVTSSASYSTSNDLRLSNVTNVANIEVGSLVSANGVGREVYVTEKNVGAQTVTLSQPLFDAEGTQTYTFKRFRYILDFSGFDYLARFSLKDIDFNCNGVGNCVILPKTGLILHFRDCDFSRPEDRAITSIGTGCQGMLIDRCQFLSDQQALLAQDRDCIGFNINANDAKIRNCRAVKWGHWAVVHGSGHLFEGNHWFQGDDELNGLRQAGLVLTSTNSKVVINGNYIDNCFVEWNNEHDSHPDQASELSFGSVSFTGNNFTALRAGPWHRFIVVKPYGSGHFINGLTVTGNTFKAALGIIDRVDHVDEEYAPLDMTRTRNIEWHSNTYHNITQWTMNPVTLAFSRTSTAQTWTCDFADWLPFGGQTRNVVSVVAQNPLRNASNVIEYAAPYAVIGTGPTGGAVDLNWSKALKGRVNVTVRMDNPY